MYTSRAFTIEIVDNTTPGATVIARLGNVILPIFQMKSGVSFPTSSVYSGTQMHTTWLGTYVDEPDMMGGWAFYNTAQNTPSESDLTTAKEHILRIAPITLIKDLGSYMGYRVRFKNSSGAYFVTSNVLSSGTYDYNTNAFDANGNSIGSFLSISAGLINTGNQPRVWLYVNALIVPAITDGNISDYSKMTQIIAKGTSATTGTSTISSYELKPISSSSTRQAYSAIINAMIPPPPAVTDPYANLELPGDDPIPDGDSISIPGMPGITATSTGIIGLFVPSVSQMQQLADFMWTDFGGTATDIFGVLEEILQAIKRTISNPLDYIFGLNIVPSQGLTVGASKVVRFGWVSSGVSMPVLASQYFVVDCGTLAFDTLCGDTFLDYAPYSKFSIYLPYIGFKNVDPNDFVGHTIGVVYHGDAVTGGVTAYITKDGSVMYQYSGSCVLNMPLSTDNWGATIAAAVQIATGMVESGISGGAAGVGESALKGVASVAANPSLLSPKVQHSGAVSGSAGCMGVQYPFVIREAVNFHSTAGFNKSSGYPAYYYKKLSDVTGYTTVIDAHMTGITGATQGEIDEIERLLESGVIL